MDAALNKMARSPDAPRMVLAKKKSTSGVVVVDPESLSPREREIQKLWASVQPNPFFLYEGLGGADAKVETEAISLMRARSHSFGVANNVQRAYDACDLIINRNEALSSAFDLVSDHGDDPPNMGLEPLFVTKKSVFIWNGRGWRSHVVMLYDNCLFVNRVGYYFSERFFHLVQRNDAPEKMRIWRLR